MQQETFQQVMSHIFGMAGFMKLPINKSTINVY